jgi:hypothetical protein
MQVDDLLDDPLFAGVRRARPVAPPSLEHDVLRRLALADRPSRRPVVIGCTVALAAILCIVLLVRDNDDQRIAIVETRAPVDAHSAPADADVVVSPDAGHDRAAPPIDAPAPPPRIDWTDLPALWAQLELQHRRALDACGAGKTVVRVDRRRDGSARALARVARTATAADWCRSKIIQNLRLPDMPADLVAIEFVITVPADVQPKHDWIDPLAVIRRAFAAENLASCVYGTSTPVFVVGRTHHANPQIQVPPDQFPGKDGGYSQVACMAKLFPKLPMPELPPMLLSVTVQHRFVKP